MALEYFLYMCMQFYDFRMILAASGLFYFVLYGPEDFANYQMPHEQKQPQLNSSSNFDFFIYGFQR